MENDALVEEIVRQVKIKIAELEKEKKSGLLTANGKKKKQLLVFDNKSAFARESAAHMKEHMHADVDLLDGMITKEKLSEYEMVMIPASMLCGEMKLPQDNAFSKENESGVTVTVTKKVITERDVMDAHSQKATEILAKKRSIITDLAEEYARRHKIRITCK